MNLRYALLYLAVSGLLCLPVPALVAQSTDPDSPTRWPAGGISGEGTGARITYYYRLSVGAGPMHVRTSVRARQFSTGLAVDFRDSNRNSVIAAGAIATSSGQTNDATLNIARSQVFLVSVAIDENTSQWGVEVNPTPVPPPTALSQMSGTTSDGGPLPGILNPPPPATGSAPALPNTGVGMTPDGRPFPGVLNPPPVRHGSGPAPGATTFPESGLSGSGTGADNTQTFLIDAGPGRVTMIVEARARTFSTAVTAGLYDERSELLREVGAIATTVALQREQGGFSLDSRRTLSLRVRTDANCGTYRVSMEGDVHR